VYVMRDIMCSGYVAGGNCNFFGTSGASLKAPVGPEDVKTALNARLSFEDDASGEYDSMLAFACPYEETAASKRDQVISISERLLPWEVSKNSDPEKKSFPGGKTGWTTYNNQWSLNQIHFGEDVRATENMAFMSQVRSCTLKPLSPQPSALSPQPLRTRQPSPTPNPNAFTRRAP